MWLLLLVLLAVIALLQAGACLLMVYEARRACAGAREKLPLQLGWAFALECVLVLAALAGGVASSLGIKRFGGGSVRPVALVPDLFASPWTLWLLARRLERHGYSPVLLDYPSGGNDLYVKAQAVAAELARRCGELGIERIDVLAHGGGGLLVRAAARLEGSEGLIGNFITLGCPHQGTALASLFTGPRLAQLRPGSPFMQRLCGGDDLPDRLRITAIASSFDAWVFPLESAYYPGAFNVTVDAVGHLGLLVSGRVWELVLENLEFGGGPVQSQAA